MALPTTSLSFSALQTEFGGSNPISLSEYYRGAGNGYVPSGTTSAYGTIPTSGQISLGVFRGTQKTAPVVISIASDSISSDAVYETDSDLQSASYGILASGLIAAQATSTNNGLTINGITDGTNWVTPTSAASNYEVRATKVSGVNPSGLLNTWLPCTSDRYWTLILVGGGQESCVLTIEIRDTATGTIRDTATPVSLFVKNSA